MRSFTLPDYIDDAKISAQYRDGLLYLHLPKTEQARPKSIEVKVTQAAQPHHSLANPNGEGGIPRGLVPDVRRGVRYAEPISQRPPPSRLACKRAYPCHMAARPTLQVSALSPLSDRYVITGVRSLGAMTGWWPAQAAQ